MTLAALKKFFDKVLVWCVQHWRWLLLSLVAIAAYVTGRKSAKSLRIQAALARDQYEHEAKFIEKSYKEKELKKKRAAEKYQNSLKQLDRLYDDETSMLNREKDKEYRALLNEAKKDPDKLDDLLEGLGITEV